MPTCWLSTHWYKSFRQILLVSKTFPRIPSLGIQNCFLFKFKFLVLSNSLLPEHYRAGNLGNVLLTTRIHLKYFHQCSNFSRLCFIKPLNQLLVNPMQNLITYLIYNTKSIQLPLQLTKYMLVRDRCHFRWKISWHLDVLGITNSQFLISQPLMWTVRFQLRISNLYT